jgi:hypothetical protein
MVFAGQVRLIGANGIGLSHRMSQSCIKNSQSEQRFTPTATQLIRN